MTSSLYPIRVDKKWIQDSRIRRREFADAAHAWPAFDSLAAADLAGGPRGQSGDSVNLELLLFS